MMRWPIGQFLRLLFVCTLGAVTLCGCSGLSPAQWVDPAVSLAWPEPPDVPRIKYLRSLYGTGDFRDQDGKGRFFEWVAGEREQGLPLVTPHAVVADGQGRFWVTDAGSRSVHMFDLERRKVDYLMAVGAEALVSPVGIGIDVSKKLLYLADSALRKVFVLDYQGQLQGLREPPGGWQRPAGMVVDTRGRLFVADVLKGRVEVFGADGTWERSIGSLLNPDGLFNRPVGVAVDREGRVFILDAMNFRVEMFDSRGESLGTIGQLGDAPGSFARPRGIAVDSQGHIYVSDAAFDYIQIFDAAKNLLLYFGGGGNRAGHFNIPAGMFFDQDDRLYVVDTYNHRVQLFKYLAR